MDFDLDDFGTVEGVEPASIKPQWRLDPKESHSDWKIITKSTTGAKLEEVYNVHKVILSTGNRRSLYFVKLFQSVSMKEHQDCQCIIEMDEMAADVFPDLLDFVYTKKHDDSVTITSETAVPLRFLANYLGIQSLYTKVNTFIRKDLQAKTAPTYLAISTVFQDEKVRTTSLQLCGKNFGDARIKFNDLSCLSPDLFQVIASLSSCDSLILSKRVTDYANSNKTIVDKSFLTHVANATIMPKIDPDAALPLIKLANDTYVDAGQGEAKSSLVRRCIDSLKDEIYVTGKYEVKLPSRMESLDDLDLTTQVKILKEMYRKATQEIESVEVFTFTIPAFGHRENYKERTAYRQSDGSYTLEGMKVYKKRYSY